MTVKAYEEQRRPDQRRRRRGRKVSSRSACRSSIRPRRSRWSRRCRSGSLKGRIRCAVSISQHGPLLIPPDSVPDRDARRGRPAFLPQPGTRRGSVVHHQGRGHHRHVARRDRRRDAGPGRRSDRKEAAGAALFRQGDDLHQAGLHRDAGRFQGQYAGARRAAVVLSAAQENQRHQGRSAGGLDRPVGQ